MNSTHHVHRGPESLPCYCAANSDHLIGEEAMSPGEKLARLFHETYERLAPSFGYETRTETRQFDPTTPNGRLMIAVCTELSDRHGAGDAEVWRSIESAPRDGRTVILGSLGVKSYTGRWHDVTWVDERGLSRGPSHWRPLPAPPNYEAARAGERGGS